MAEKQLNVYQRISLAKQLVAKSTFTKDKSEGLKYPYLPIEQIKPVVEDAMNEAGLILDFGPLDTYNIREPYEKVSPYNGEKTMWYHLGGTQDFAWVNIDDPSDKLVQTFSGEAKDNSDKCVSKLYTAILKNFYKQFFNISTDRKDDPDNTEDEKKEEDAYKKAKLKESEERVKKIADDPLFGRAVKERETKKEKPKEEANPLEVIETLIKECKENSDKDFDHVTDRTIELMNNQIMKWYSGDQNLRSIIKLFADPRAYGDDNDSWTEEQIKNCYYVCTCKGGDC